MGIIGSIGKYELLVIIGIALIGFVIPLIISYRITKQKNLPTKLWLFLTVIFGWPITIALFFIPKRNESKEN
jgi:ABC-type arginine/histidine transport system permease subunit